MIVDRIYEYLATTGKPIQAAYLDASEALFRRTLERNFGEEVPRTVRLPSPSSSWSCMRKRLYEAHPESVKGDGNPRRKVIFAAGDTWEALAVLLARQAGVPVLTPADDGTQLELSTSPKGYELKGHMDLTIADAAGGHIPVDVKSMADYTFDKFVAATQDPNAPYWSDERDGYVAQVRFYQYLIRAKGMGMANVGYLLGVNKNTGHMAELAIPHDPKEEARLVAEFIATGDRVDAMRKGGLDYIQTVPRPAWTGTIKRVAQRPDGSKGAVEEVDTVFDRTRHGRDFQGWRCGYCDFIETCWPGFQKVLMSKPVWRKAV